MAPTGKKTPSEKGLTFIFRFEKLILQTTREYKEANNTEQANHAFLEKINEAVAFVEQEAKKLTHEITHKNLPLDSDENTDAKQLLLKFELLLNDFKKDFEHA